MARKKSWREKLHGNPDLPSIETLYDDSAPPRLKGWMVVPSPTEVYEIMKEVPAGSLITAQEIRRILARRHGADLACPLRTGICIGIAAQAAEEAARDGEPDTPPYWRTLKSGGLLNEKYPGGVEEQRRRLEAEGHRVERRGKHFCVPDYGDSLMDEDDFSR